jgi:DedD protein
VDPRLKQRLVGAAVLLALAVIFLPMLLDGTGRDAQVSLRDAIPPEPEFLRPETAPPLALDSPPDVPAGETRPPPRSEARSAEPDPLPPRSAPVEPPAESAPTSSPPAPTPAQAPVQERPSGEPAGDPGGFAVQVGSFGEEANARTERDRLRDLGFTAFVEPARANGRMFYRVKVGPVAERSEAERLRDRMKDQVELQGIVVAHP